MSVIAKQNKQFILFVATRRLLILFNCHISDNFVADNAGSTDERGQWAISFPYFPLLFTFPVSYAENLLLCHSPKHPNLIGPVTSESSRGHCISYLDFLINAERSLFPQ